MTPAKNEQHFAMESRPSREAFQVVFAIAGLLLLPAALTLRPLTDAVRTRNRGVSASPCSQFQTTPAEWKISIGAMAVDA